MGSHPALTPFSEPTRTWFEASFEGPTEVQQAAWGPIVAGESTLLVAPTGSGKTLAAFLASLDRVMFATVPPKGERCRVLYVSPLKALAADVERNLRAPLEGIAATAELSGTPFHRPEVMVRSGDTPASERARFGRRPSDLLITTPESLYLLLTSNARERLRSIETVIIDEIHALVPSKRGAHLALSLERLETLTDSPPQRIGLSATCRPLDEVARFLGGRDEAGGWRPVRCVDVGARRPLSLSVEVPIEDMANLAASADAPQSAYGSNEEGAETDAARAGEPSSTAEPPLPHIPKTPSIWTALHPKLLELVQSHTSTLVFVNSRRVAERVAGALNELAGETLVFAHHGSLARAQRIEVEEALKAGAVRGLVATSSLELGIDMGAIDLVVQVSAPPSVASGLQRVGRAGHGVGRRSDGILYPKYRGDLLACAAITQGMLAGEVEPIRYPRNALDVLAQQLVAEVALAPGPVPLEALFERCRRAAPYAELPRPLFESVLDMLSGRYASEELTDLKPRLTWDRVAGHLTAREGARRIAVANGGTIPDRGLYGVFLAGAEGKPGARVGELDEEMVFESAPGETFVLGASTWRIEEIGHDRVTVSPAPGEPGKMPFWKGEQPPRPLEVGRRLGALSRTLLETPLPAARSLLRAEHCLTGEAADNLLRYLRDQRAVTGTVPSDTTLVVERLRDALGDWRLCLLSPLGGQVHAPWALAMTAKARKAHGEELEVLWGDDGMVLRFPDTDTPPDERLLRLEPGELESLLLEELPGTALFAARFREAAGRSLLLTRRQPGRRTPLWQTRRRAHDLLRAASRHDSFPLMLEAHRECLSEVFDVPGLTELLGALADGRLRFEVVDTATPSPFAASLLFGYAANFIYEGDAPLAERRAQALSIDPAQLHALLGTPSLRGLLAPAIVEELYARLQRLVEERWAKSADGVHDLLLTLGDLSQAELEARATPEAVAELATLASQRRILQVALAGARRWIPVEYAARYRDALGVALPRGLPEVLLAPSPSSAPAGTGAASPSVASAGALGPLEGLALRFARTRTPFTVDELALRYGLSTADASRALASLVDAGRLIEGALTAGGTQRELVDPDVLRTLRSRSLAQLRREVEAVPGDAAGRLAVAWQGVVQPGRGLDALLDAVERLQGLPLPASILETELLPARVRGYAVGDLDRLASAGEVVWVGVETLGDRDGRVALYLTDQLQRLWRPPAGHDASLDPLEARIEALLHERGAVFFSALAQTLGGFEPELADALWRLVWRGRVACDTFAPLRARTRPAPKTSGRRASTFSAPRSRSSFRSRRAGSPEVEGRWWAVADRVGQPPSDTQWSAAIAHQLLQRHGLVTRETALAEGLPGGFSAVYAVLRSLEEGGRIRRGYFVEGLGALQFAEPAALDLLRRVREPPEAPEAVVLSAVDPANPYGATLPWPRGGDGPQPSRSVGTHVVLVDGALAAWLSRGGQRLRLLLPSTEAESSSPRCPDFIRSLAEALAGHAAMKMQSGAGLLIEEIDGASAAQHSSLEALEEAGFSLGPRGLVLPKALAARRLASVSDAAFGRDAEMSTDQD